jgi:hypothetical protein
LVNPYPNNFHDRKPRSNVDLSYKESIDMRYIGYFSQRHEPKQERKDLERLGWMGR